MRVSDILTEDRTLGRLIAASIRAKASLSWEAADAVDTWQQVGWATGKLERAFRGQLPDLRDEITAAFEPVREIMRSLYGDTILLHRGQQALAPGEAIPGRVLFSWTAEPKVARYFVQDRSIQDLSDAEIERAMAQYERTGYVEVAGRKYLRSKTNPAYYNIYKGREYITDGDDLLADLKNEQESRREYNEDKLQQGRVVSEHVPIDAIVWVTNDLNCKEFICMWNPLEANRAAGNNFARFA